MSVAIQSQGDAGTFHQAAQQTQVARAVFVLDLEVRGGYLAGGIVDQSQEGELGAAPFQPSVAGAIDEQQHPSRARRIRRERYFAGRRFCGECSPAWRRIHRTVERLTVIASWRVSFSHKCVSLNPAYLPRANSVIRPRSSSGV